MKEEMEMDGNRRPLGGYMTLEAAMVFPAVFALIIMLLYATFFLYDKCRMTQDLYTAAYRQSIARSANAGETKIDTSGYFMLLSRSREGTGEGSGVWEIKVAMEARKTDPPQSFRRYRRIAAIARQALSVGGAGDE